MPELGKVKSRIAETAGAARAYEIYVQLVKRCRNLLETVDESVEVEVTFAEPFDFIKGQQFFGMRPFYSLQTQGNLGQRMCVAAIRGFEGGSKKVILIGSDCPTLTAEHISQAIRILDELPVVFGKARDGGYYLLGMSRIVPELFGDLPWSREDLLAQSVERLTLSGIPHGLLPELNDIDTLEDWEDYVNSLPT
jgi:rSAM/selenodomain-associated transferase 1